MSSLDSTYTAGRRTFLGRIALGVAACFAPPLGRETKRKDASRTAVEPEPRAVPREGDGRRP